VANKYELGDIVKLNSGGPDMSVKTVPLEARVWYRCDWFAGKKLESGEFREEQLILVKKKP